ncbi:MAG: hypothetical protein PVI30_02080 [Myxococcales bacterium]|jgi:hypothetical protein
MNGSLALGLRLLLAALAAFGLLCLALLATGHLPESWSGGERDDGALQCPPCAERTAPTDRADGPHPGADPASDPGAEIRRVRVCEREEGLPRLIALELPGQGAPRWLVHCGSSAHLIAFDRNAGELFPRRVARLGVSEEIPTELPRAGPALVQRTEAGDFLLVSVLRVDGSGAPVGGAVHRMPLTSGGALGAPMRLLSIAPGGLTQAELDGQAPPELLALNLGEPRVARPAELWVLDGTVAPTRSARLEASPYASALIALDLDGDGRADPLVAAGEGGETRLWTPSSEGLGEPRAIDGAVAHAALAWDDDGDGRADPILEEGAALHLRMEDGEPVVDALPNSDGLRGLHAHDFDSDGRVDLVGYAPPELVGLHNGEGRLQRRTLLRLTGDGVSVADVRLAHLDDDGATDLVALVIGSGPDAHVELAYLQSALTSDAARFARGSRPLADAPLRLAFDFE